MTILSPMIMRINPPTISIFLPKKRPVLLPMNNPRNVKIEAVRPIITTGNKRATVSKYKVKPTANASILTATENIKRFNPLNSLAPSIFFS